MELNQAFVRILVLINDPPTATRYAHHEASVHAGSILISESKEHSGAKLGGPAVVLARFTKSTSSRIYSKHNRILYLREHIPDNIFWIHLDTTKQYICATSHHEHMRENIF